MIQRHGRGLYGPALESLRSRPLERRDARVSLFLKAEKWQLPAGTELKTPRAIQFRGPRYNICLARYLAPLEKRLYSLLQRSHTRQRLYSSKGLCPTARAQQVRRLWERHPRPAVLCLDSSRFDAHVSEGVLRAEHSVYQELSRADRHLSWLLGLQRRNRGRGVHGTEYFLRGGRMSGDVNTALGNTVVNGGMLWLACRGEVADILVEGDDALVFAPLEVCRRLADRLPVALERWGFELRVSSIARTLGEISYCSSAVIAVGADLALSVREWPKPLVTDCWTVKPVTGRAVAKKAYTLAVGLWYLYRGVPVYQAWAEYLLSWVGPTKVDPWYDREWWRRVQEAMAGPACEATAQHPDARAGFAEVSGLPPSDQLALEARLRAHQGPHPTHPPGIRS